VDTIQLFVVGRVLSCVYSPIDRHGDFRASERRLRESYLRPVAAHLQPIRDPGASVDETRRRRRYHRRLHPSSRSHFQVSFLSPMVVPLSSSFFFSQDLLLVLIDLFHDR